MAAPRLAVIGCGAVTRDVHLPALRELPELRLVGLVDSRREHADELARGCEGVWAAADHREALDRVDAVLVASPPHLHAAHAIDCLRAGVHVLVEKPMALGVVDCDRMIAAAEQSGAILAVALNRRFFDSNRLVKDLVDGGVLGPIRRFEIAGEGTCPWPMRSAYRYRREHGGGILADTGIHFLDLLCWWFGTCERLEYRDDAEGGVEAECHVRLEFAGGVAGELLLTRLRDVPSFFRFEFEGGALLLENAGSEPSPRVRLEVAGVEWNTADAGAPRSRREIFRRQLADFAAAIRDGREPFVPGREGRRSVELLARCYADRRRLEHPWEAPVRVPQQLVAGRR
jgi:predicted dehydrogenase